MSGDGQHRQALARQLRVDSIRSSTAAGSGHPTSSMSAADLMAVLVDGYLRLDFTDPHARANDHLVFSKGHASPLLYAIFRAVGAIDDAEMMSFRKRGSRMQGHPTPLIPWVDVATGSLGQGLPLAVGIALAAQRLDQVDARVWVLLGDSEMAEGSVWEAFAAAANLGLTNLIGIIDVNRLGQRGETMYGWDTDVYVRRAEAFGWDARAIDGHDLAAIAGAYDWALAPRARPCLIVARTLKGKGVSAIEDKEGWHGTILKAPDAERAIAELGGPSDLQVNVARPTAAPAAAPAAPGAVELPAYPLGTQVATRNAFGDALAAIGKADPRVVVLDAEVGNSTMTQTFGKAVPERFFQMYIAEQQMVAASIGLQTAGYIPYSSTFGAFYSRAYDFIRMAAISNANIKLCGSHAGVSIGEDGPSQMGLEDIAMMRAVHGSTVLYPCDANQTAALVDEVRRHHAIDYIRTTRGATPVIYAPGESFPIGGSRVLRESAADRATLIGAGVTLHEALAAHATLAAEGIAVGVIDAYSVKPIDVATIRNAAETTGLLVVVEDHWPEGGLGDAVLSALADGVAPMARVVKLAVQGLPGSATPEQLREDAGISAAHIVAAVKAHV